MNFDKLTALKVLGYLMTIGGTLVAGYVGKQENKKTIEKSVVNYLEKKGL